MKTIIALVLALFSMFSHADTVGLHTWSWHAPAKHAWNNDNYGLYWRSDSGHLVGAYCNSYSGISARENKCNVTVYAGETWELGHLGELNFSVAALVAHGYGRHHSTFKAFGEDFRIGVLPSVSYGPARVSVMSNGVHLSFEHSF